MTLCRQSFVPPVCVTIWRRVNFRYRVNIWRHVDFAQVDYLVVEGTGHIGVGFFSSSLLLSIVEVSDTQSL